MLVPTWNLNNGEYIPDFSLSLRPFVKTAEVFPKVLIPAFAALGLSKQDFPYVLNNAVTLRNCHEFLIAELDVVDGKGGAIAQVLGRHSVAVYGTNYDPGESQRVANHMVERLAKLTGVDTTSYLSAERAVIEGWRVLFAQPLIIPHAVAANFVQSMWWRCFGPAEAKFILEQQIELMQLAKGAPNGVRSHFGLTMPFPVTFGGRNTIHSSCARPSRCSCCSHEAQLQALGHNDTRACIINSNSVTALCQADEDWLSTRSILPLQILARYCFFDSTTCYFDDCTCSQNWILVTKSYSFTANDDDHLLHSNSFKLKERELLELSVQWP